VADGDTRGGARGGGDCARADGAEHAAEADVNAIAFVGSRIFTIVLCMWTALLIHMYNQTHTLVLAIMIGLTIGTILINFDTMQMSAKS